MRAQHGIALVTVLLVTSLVSVVALGLALLVSMEHLAGANHRDGTILTNLADSGLDLAAHELDRVDDWSTVLTGAVQSAAVDGPPWGSRVFAHGQSLDLGTQTNLLNCRQQTPCTPGQMQALSRERPWGANNPVWRPFVYGAAEGWATLLQPAAVYVVVWVADDGRETDGDPSSDGALAEPGRHVLRVRADAFGRGGGRRSVQAEVVRVCPGESAGLPCRAGARVQARRDEGQAVP